MTSIITFYYYSVVSFVVVILLCEMYKFNSYNWHIYIYIYEQIYLGSVLAIVQASPELSGCLPMDKTGLLCSTQALFFSGLHRLTFQ